MRAHFKAKGGGKSESVKICVVSKIKDDGIVKLMLPSGLKQKVPVEWIAGIQGEGFDKDKGGVDRRAAQERAPRDHAGKSPKKAVGKGVKEVKKRQEDRLLEVKTRQKEKRKTRRLERYRRKKLEKEVDEKERLEREREERHAKKEARCVFW